MNNTPKYLTLLEDKPKCRAVLSAIDSFLVCTFSVLFVLFVVGVSVGSSITEGLVLLALSATSFLVVSVFRRLFNAPRPKQVYPTLENVPDKEGRSMPSRHVFCAALISVLLLGYAPTLGIIMLVFALCMGACRVLRGLHFLRDVIAGCFCGVVSGLFGSLIIHLM